MVDIDTTLQGRYLIRRPIGSGGMGAVYEARDQRLGVTVAVKESFFVDASGRRAFEHEARLLASLRHPVLPRVSDYFTEGSAHYLVMDYVPGEDLAEHLRRTGRPTTVEQVLEWADRLLGALEYLHGQNPPVVHRDIKPSNLKVTPGGSLMLLDFGLAKGQPAEASRMSGMVSVAGYTPYYAPPEQVAQAGTDARSDLYALGATLYHLLTAAPPPEARLREMALQNGLPDPLRRVSDLNSAVPDLFATILQHALALDPSRRFASATAMRRALGSIPRPTPPLAPDRAAPHRDESRPEIERLYESATRAYASEDWPTAIQYLRDVESIDPAYRDTARLLGDARRALERAEEERKLAALFDQANERLEHGDWTVAIERLTEVESLRPGYRGSAQLLQQARRELERSRVAPIWKPDPDDLEPEPEAAERPLPTTEERALLVSAGVLVALGWLVHGLTTQDFLMRAPAPDEFEVLDLGYTLLYSEIVGSLLAGLLTVLGLRRLLHAPPLGAPIGVALGAAGASLVGHAFAQSVLFNPVLDVAYDLPFGPGAALTWSMFRPATGAVFGMLAALPILFGRRRVAARWGAALVVVAALAAAAGGAIGHWLYQVPITVWGALGVGGIVREAIRLRRSGDQADSGAPSGAA